MGAVKQALIEVDDMVCNCLNSGRTLNQTIRDLRTEFNKRGRDNNKEINLRLSYAINEMKHYNEYKYVLINEPNQG